jgi:hypothetical protein
MGAQYGPEPTKSDIARYHSRSRCVASRPRRHVVDGVPPATSRCPQRPPLAFAINCTNLSTTASLSMPMLPGPRLPAVRIDRTWPPSRHGAGRSRPHRRRWRPTLASIQINVCRLGNGERDLDDEISAARPLVFADEPRHRGRSAWRP